MQDAVSRHVGGKIRINAGVLEPAKVLRGLDMHKAPRGPAASR
jgi:hypothetical protein